jgi:hypothetical protein
MLRIESPSGPYISTSLKPLFINSGYILEEGADDPKTIKSDATSSVRLMPNGSGVREGMKRQFSRHQGQGLMWVEVLREVSW